MKHKILFGFCVKTFQEKRQCDIFNSQDFLVKLEIDITALFFEQNNEKTLINRCFQMFPLWYILLLMMMSFREFRYDTSTVSRANTRINLYKVIFIKVRALLSRKWISMVTNERMLITTRMFLLSMWGSRFHSIIGSLKISPSFDQRHSSI